MNETTLGIIYFILVAISIAVLIAFFSLCSNVSKIRKHLVGSEEPEEIFEVTSDSVDEIKKDIQADRWNFKLTQVRKTAYSNKLIELGVSEAEINKLFL